MAYKKYLWLMVTEDEFELPLVVAGSVDELARHLGVRPATIRSAYCKLEKKQSKFCKYRRVEVDEE